MDYEQRFFEKARGLSPRTLTAIRRLLALRQESPFFVEFNGNQHDDSMLIYVREVSTSAAVLKVESSGAIMLFTAHGAMNAIRNELDALARKLGKEPPAGKSTKPRFKQGTWEHRVEAIVSTLRELARQSDPAVADAPLRRRSGSPPAPVPVATAPTVAALSPGDAVNVAGALVPVWAPDQPTSDPAELEARVAAILRSEVPPDPPSGIVAPKRVPVAGSSTFERSPAVKAWVLTQAKGRCEACRSTAPFVSTDGQPFLEVHHVVPLSASGPDTVANAVALCPNCHRALHHASDAAERTEALGRQVPRLA